jgi:hypothetical protein
MKKVLEFPWGLVPMGATAGVLLVFPGFPPVTDDPISQLLEWPLAAWVNP